MVSEDSFDPSDSKSLKPIVQNGERVVKNRIYESPDSATCEDTNSFSREPINGEEKLNEIKESQEPYTAWGYRHQQCFILFWIFSIGYTMRSCMGVSVVAMTKFNKQDNNMTGVQDGNATEDITPDGILNILMLVPPYPIFNWDKKIQDALIASFFWGYICLQIPAGQLAHRFGPKYMLIAAMAINSIASIVLPTVTYYGGWYSTVACRIVQGLAQAFFAPGIHTCLGKWAPLHERGQLASFVYGSQAMGTLLGLPLTGFISASPMGWPGIFRFYGILAAIMALIIYLFLYDSPAKHPKISARERKYIEDDLGTKGNKKKLPVPWKKILTHKGVLATIIAHFCQTWGHLVLYSEVPAYMDRIMEVNLKANGLLTALPFFIMWFASFFFNWITDWLVVNKVMSVTNTRKLANSLGTVPPAIGLIALAYAPKNIYVVEAILIFICTFKIAVFCGFPVNQIDIAPNFSGTMMSISTFISNIGSSIGPIFIGFILTNVSDPSLWRQVFFLAAGFYLVSNMFYIILGTSDRAEWNDPVREEIDEEEQVPIMNSPKER